MTACSAIRSRHSGARAKRGSPEAILQGGDLSRGTCSYGFRAPAFGRPRNDAVLVAPSGVQIRPEQTDVIVLLIGLSILICGAREQRDFCAKNSETREEKRDIKLIDPGMSQFADIRTGS